MQRLTFKEYLDSKEHLRQAICETPIRVVEYTVRTYCKIPVGECKETKEFISLKPKQEMTVEWSYEDINNPKPTLLKFDLLEDQYTTYWQGWKLEKWLIINTKEKQNV